MFKVHEYVTFIIFVRRFMLTLNKNIGILVDENFILARALHYLGVEFYHYSEKTLMQLCEERGLKLKTVLSTFDNFSKSFNLEQKDLKTYPIELIIEYLKHAHHQFIKNRLPYISTLIKDLEDFPASYSCTVKDLKMIFPVFLEDFIKHIYEEEDTMFQYILRLNSICNHKEKLPSRTFLEIKDQSIEALAHHHEEENELEGLTEMINCISARRPNQVHLRTIIRELNQFDGEVRNHAHIENSILFPKALIIEQEACKYFRKLGQLN